MSIYKKYYKTDFLTFYILILCTLVYFDVQLVDQESRRLLIIDEPKHISWILHPIQLDVLSIVSIPQVVNRLLGRISSEWRRLNENLLIECSAVSLLGILYALYLINYYEYTYPFILFDLKNIPIEFILYPVLFSIILNSSKFFTRVIDIVLLLLILTNILFRLFKQLITLSYIYPEFIVFSSCILILSIQLIIASENKFIALCNESFQLPIIHLMNMIIWILILLALAKPSMYVGLILFISITSIALNYKKQGIGINLYESSTEIIFYTKWIMIKLTTYALLYCLLMEFKLILLPNINLIMIWAISMLIINVNNNLKLYKTSQN